MIKGTGQRLIPRKLLEWIKGLHKGEGAGLNISTLTDSKGNPRFIEGDGTPLTQTGVDISYCKWSLSGTHLMLVVAGTLNNTTALTSGTALATFDIPDFIKNKVVPVWGEYIEVKTIGAKADNWTNQDIQYNFAKSSQTGNLIIKLGANVTMTATRHFRTQFDLLIDSE